MDDIKQGYTESDVEYLTRIKNIKTALEKSTSRWSATHDRDLEKLRKLTPIVFHREEQLKLSNLLPKVNNPPIKKKSHGGI